MSNAERFQVDLTGMVDLLSKHLYSGPQVFVRELLQNGVDAITAGSTNLPARIRINCGWTDAGVPTVEFCDTGVGLTAENARELLATIGRSSKKDADLNIGRAEFIGQFGIGMLAAFMVADQITVLSQAAGAQPVRWVGNANGTFEVSEVTAAELPEMIRAGGTAVRLQARADAHNWLEPESVRSLVRHYGDLLPVPVELAASALHAETGVIETLNRRDVPWRATYPTRTARTQALLDYGQEIFGFRAMHVIDLEVPALGISGAAYVLPQQVAPGSGQHRVYLKRMLLGDRLDRVLPEWAFFVRAVLDTDSLQPTASREQLHEDETLLIAREALGAQLKNWMREQLEQGSTLSDFLSTHNLALRAVAAQDREMLELVAETVPYETTDGLLTLQQAAAGGELLYTRTVQAFKRVSAVARAANLTVVNGGYAYDLDLISKLEREHGWQIRELESDDLTQALTSPTVERELVTAAALTRAREILADADCDVVLRSFEPDHIPAMLLRDADGEFQHDLEVEREASPDLWDGLLDAFVSDSAKNGRTLVLNDATTVVHTLLDAPRDEVFEAGIVSLYVSAVSLAGEGLRAGESAALADSLDTLLRRALGQQGE